MPAYSEEIFLLALFSPQYTDRYVCRLLCTHGTNSTSYMKEYIHIHDALSVLVHTASVTTPSNPVTVVDSTSPVSAGVEPTEGEATPISLSTDIDKRGEVR